MNPTRGLRQKNKCCSPAKSCQETDRGMPLNMTALDFGKAARINVRKALERKVNTNSRSSDGEWLTYPTTSSVK